MTVANSMMTKNKFSKQIEDIVFTKKIPYIEAILYFCENNNIDPEDVKKYISLPIRSKIEAEAINLNFLPKGNELPFD